MTAILAADCAATNRHLRVLRAPIRPDLPHRPEPQISRWPRLAPLFRDPGQLLRPAAPPDRPRSASPTRPPAAGIGGRFTASTTFYHEPADPGPDAPSAGA